MIVEYILIAHTRACSVFGVFSARRVSARRRRRWRSVLDPVIGYGDGSGASNIVNTELYGRSVLEKWRTKWSALQLSELICLAREGANYKERNQLNEAYIKDLRGQIALMEDAQRLNEAYIGDLLRHIEGLELALRDRGK